MKKGIVVTVESVIAQTPRDKPRGMAYGRGWVLIEAGSTENELREMEICMCFQLYMSMPVG